jgi:type I restriction enzyme S subunit
MFGDPVTNPMGWEVLMLKDIATEKLSYGSGASSTNYDNEIRYVRITDITDNGELNNDIVSPSEYDEKYLLRDGDILFARSGATVGKTFKYSEKWGICIYAGYLIRLIPDTNMVLPDYIFAYTKTDYYQEFVKLNQRTVAQPNINAQQYGDLGICVPPLSLQNRFAEFVKQADKSSFEIRRTIDELEATYKAILRENLG